MTRRTITLVIAIFTLVSSLPASGVLPSSVFAQVEEAPLDQEDNIASSIVSNVLDGDGSDDEEEDGNDATNAEIINQDSTTTDSATVNPNQEDQTVDQGGFNEFGDDTNIQVAVPISDQDQTAENRAANLDLEIVRIQQPPPTTPPPGNAPTAQTCEPYGPEFTLENGECIDREEPAQTCEPYGPEFTLENGECIDTEDADQTCEALGPEFELINGVCIDREEPAQTCEPYGPEFTLENGECIDREEPAQT